MNLCLPLGLEQTEVDGRIWVGQGDEYTRVLARNILVATITDFVI